MKIYFHFAVGLTLTFNYSIVIKWDYISWYNLIIYN